MESILRKRLLRLYSNNPARFHMPGHKGRLGDPLDITEVDGSDSLHDPKDIIKKVEEKIADLSGSHESIMLIGSTTAGLQSAIIASLQKNEKIAIPVNAHRCVYPGLAIVGAEPVYFVPNETPPGYSVTLNTVKSVVKNNPNLKAFLIVSPDYYGCISPIEEIASFLHERGVKLIVDQAHGAHLRYTEHGDAVSQGADLVVESSHKMLSAPTQTGLVHVKDDSRPVRKVLRLLESSSPSYLLLMGLEEAIDYADREGDKRFREIYDYFDNFLDLPVIYSENFDRAKLVFSLRQGVRLTPQLSKMGIIPELEEPGKILFMTGIATTVEDLQKLENVLRNVEGLGENNTLPLKLRTFEGADLSYCFKCGVLTDLSQANGRVLTEFIVPYPPGIPAYIPGMRLKDEDINYIQELAKNRTLNGIVREGDKIYVETCRN